MRPARLTKRRLHVLLYPLVATAFLLTSLPQPKAQAIAPASPAPSLGAWSPIGEPQRGGISSPVSALLFHGGSLYVGGEFEGVSPTRGGTIVAGTSLIARWDPATQSWSPLGSGLTGEMSVPEVNNLEADANGLYAMGRFSSSGAMPMNNVAKWVSNAWSSLPAGSTEGLDGYPISSSLKDGNLVLSGHIATAGDWTGVGGVAVHKIAKWNGSAWSALTPGLETYANALTVFDNSLIAAGSFTADAQPNPLNHVAKWNGSSWSTLGAGLDSTVRALIPMDGHLYAGGDFSNPAGKVVSWDGTTWTSVGSGIRYIVSTLAADESRGLLYAGGDWASHSDAQVTNTYNRLTVWDTGIASWVPMGPLTQEAGDLTYSPTQAIEVYGFMTSIAPNGADVYVGCSCVISAQDYLSKWTWSAPTGTNALSGSTGDTVTISGTGFVGVPATGGVTFGSTAVPFTRTGTSQINATVPVGLSSGRYTINVNAVGGTVSIGTVDVTQRSVSSATTAVPTTTTTTTTTSSTSSPTVTTATTTTVAAATTNTAPTASAIKLFPPKVIASITSRTVGAGDDVELDAGGFQPSETVIVGFAEDPTGISTVTASASGRASATVKIPTAKNGKVTAYLYGTSSKRGVRQTLTITTLPETGADTSLPTLLGAFLVVLGMLVAVRRRLVH